MGKLVLNNASIVIDGTDLSKRASQVSIDLPIDDVDLSAFQGEFKDHGVGLKDASIQVTFFQDYEAGMVDDVLFPLYSAGEAFIIEIKPDKGAKSASNPLYKMEVRMFNYSPISGSVGQASTTQVTFQNASDEKGLERLTA
jgi:hypothetical protein